MASKEHYLRDSWTGLGHFLEGLVFPARPMDMIRHARERQRQDAVHEEIISQLKQLPDREFRSPDEVEHQITKSGSTRH